jgi:hypothetical protein
MNDEQIAKLVYEAYRTGRIEGMAVVERLRNDEIEDAIRDYQRGYEHGLAEGHARGLKAGVDCLNAKSKTYE